VSSTVLRTRLVAVLYEQRLTVWMKLRSEDEVSLGVTMVERS